MAPFDRSYTTFYWSAIVSMALSGTFLSYLTLNDIMTLKSRLEVTQDHSSIRKLGCGFLFAFHSYYGCILHHVRDIARYWSKIVIFSYPLHSTPPLGGSRSPWEYYHPVWYGKNRMVGLPDGEKTLWITV